MNKISIAIAMALLAGCNAPAGIAQTEEAESLAQPLGRAALVQAGAKLFVLGVTDDGHAIYQQGTALYATALVPGAPKELIANTGSAIGVGHPLVFASGNVVFIYPDSDFSGTIVSRLYVWTAAGGARLAASASLGAPGLVAASPDSRDIVFVANASADGNTGDLVSAAADLSRRRTLVSGASINPAGACPPQLGFDRKPSITNDSADCDAGAAHPVAGYCVGTSTTAVLSRWIDGTRHDLASDVHGFPLWSTDTLGKKLFTLVGHPFANQRPISIDADGKTTLLEDVTTGGGTINADNSIMTFAKPSDFEMHRFSGQPPRANVVTDMGASFNIYFNAYPSFLRDYATGFTSSAGLALFSSPSNLVLVDTTQAPSAAVTMQADPSCYPSFEPFSADSRHTLLYCNDDASVTALYDGSRAGTLRKITSGSAEDWTNFAVEGAVITYADDLVHSPADQDLSATVDIKELDLAAATLAPKTLAAGAYSIYFPTRDRRSVVFTSDNGAAHGLYALRIR